MHVLKECRDSGIPGVWSFIAYALSTIPTIRIVVDGIETEYVDINNILGPFLFSLMVNDVKPVDPKNNILVKFADDMTICAPVKSTGDSASIEVRNIENWASNNKMSLNLSKTWEMLVSGGTLKPLPPATVGIERKKWLKLLGITFQDDPRCWDLHVDNLLSKAGSRTYRVRQKYLPHFTG